MQTVYTAQVITDNDGNTIERIDTQGTGAESSVEITQNAKGEPRVTVKVYHADATEAAQRAVLTYEQTLIALKEVTV